MSLYQSRLLRFLNRHSLRFRDRLGQTARQLKVAAGWGVQMLIYPVYLLVQTGRLAGQSLGKNVDSQSLPPADDLESHPIPVDQPIARILTLIDPWLTPDLTPVPDSPTLDQLSQQVQQRVQLALQERKVSPASPLPWQAQLTHQLKKAITGDDSPKLAIQGVASTLEDHQLVLVTTQNNTLDLLNDEQQNKLEQQIKAELANYYYEKRLYHLVGRHFPSLIPQFTEKDPQVSPPVRWFWRTMRWVQTSDVAIALNLFGESSLVQVSTEKPDLQPHPDFPQGEWGQPTVLNPQNLNQPDLSQFNALIQSAIDYFYGGLRQSPLANSPLVQSLPDASLLIQQKLQETAKFSQENLLKPASSQLQKLSEQLYAKSEDPDPFRIQVILEAAIAHFFADSSHRKIKGNFPNQGRLSGGDVADPWLTVEDIFPVRFEVTSYEESPVLSLPESSSLPHLSPQIKPISPSQGIEKIKAKPKSLIKSIPKTTDVIPSLEEDISIELSPEKNVSIESLQTHSTSQAIGISQERSESDHSLEFSADWIEAESITMGYVKHPLERLLKGLDIVILWLEEMLVKLWKSVRQVWQ